MKNCPECKAWVDGMVCQQCGHRERGAPKPAGTAVPADPAHFLCHWTDNGRRCQNGGGLSSATTGVGPWYCAKHFPPFVHWQTDRASGPPASFAAIRAKLPSVPQVIDYASALPAANDAYTSDY